MYDFNAPVSGNAGPVSNNIANETIARWNSKKSSDSSANSIFYFGDDQTKRFHGQKMSDNHFHSFLQQLDQSDHSSMNIKIVIRMAVGSGGNIRPLIGFSTQSFYDISNNYSGNYWQFPGNRFADPEGTFDGDGTDNQHEMTPTTASEYEGGLHLIPVDELYKTVSYLSEGPGEYDLPTRTYVDLYVFDHDAVWQFYNAVLNGTNGNVQFYLLFGAAEQSPRDGSGWHPVTFRPILVLKYLDDSPERATTSDSHFWDYSNPCPPNCRAGS